MDIMEWLKMSHIYGGSVQLFTDVLHYRDTSRKVDPGKHIFFFIFGSVVFFNYTEMEEQEMCTSLDFYKKDQVPEEHWEVEELDFKRGSKFGVNNDVITLESNDDLEKLTVAFALAQCMKLAIYETRIENEIQDSAEIPEQLASEGTVTIGNLDVKKKLGMLFIHRSSVNLESEILDTPEVFWDMEQDHFKPKYTRLCRYLELDQRLIILNNRLDLLQELYGLVRDEQSHQASTNVELIIIALIVMEVLYDVGWEFLVKGVFNLY